MDDPFSEAKTRSLAQAPKLGRPKGALGQIRIWHHRIAQYVAMGFTDTHVASLVDRSPPTIRNFRLNPANAELIASYAKDVDQEILSEAEYRLRLVRRAGTLALERLVAKLEDGEEMTDRNLLAVADSANDRAGIPKSAVSIGVNLDAGDRLARARARVRELNEKPILEGVVQGNVVVLERKRRF